MGFLRSIFSKILSIIKNIGILVTMAIGVALVATAYCGYVDPEKTANFAVLGMGFPIVLVVHLIVLLVWLVVRRWRVALMSLLFVVACYPALITFSPLNFVSELVPADSTFKVLTYNVMNFDDSEKKKGENRTLRYILNANADIVILQEAAALVKMDDLDIIKSLIPELNGKYPYREKRLRDLVILSKYPYTVETEKIVTTTKALYNKSTAYKVRVKGKVLNVINVHLESIGLTDNDKALYREITDISSSSENLKENLVDEVKSGMLTKLATAFKHRASQAKDVRAYIDSLGNENVILCGDFNDTPYSFSYNTIKGDDMLDAYKECALGPTITFHDNRFYFRIDHVLYKGDFEAVDIKRGNEKSSDHYPLLVTFHWK